MSYPGCSILMVGSVVDNLIGKSGASTCREIPYKYTEFVDFNCENWKKKIN